MPIIDKHNNIVTYEPHEIKRVVIHDNEGLVRIYLEEYKTVIDCRIDD